MRRAYLPNSPAQPERQRAFPSKHLEPREDALSSSAQSVDSWAVEAASQTRSKLSRVDLLGMAAGLGFSLSLSYLFARGRIFWEDELLGWMLLRDPSWHHMVSAWKMGADGGGFGFYLTGRGWFALFGPSEISLRMYSAASLGLAFVVVWLTARHFYSIRTVAFALFNTWFFSPPIVIHMAEGRFYGLLVLSTSLVVWLTAVLSRRPGRTAIYLYPLTFLFHAMLTTSHLLGIVYSCSLLAAMIVLDRGSRRIRPALYACAAASWLLLVPERAAIIASAQVGKPHFWTTPPTLIRFVGAYTAFSAEVAGVLTLLAVGLILTLRHRPEGVRIILRSAFHERRPVWVVTFGLLLIPVAYLVEGWFGPSLFVNRYLLPVTLAQVLLTAEAVKLIDWHYLVPNTLRRRPWIFHVATACFLIALLGWIFGHVRLMVIPPKNYADGLTAILPKGIPVVCEDAWTFSELLAREHDSGVEYTYLLDWPWSVSPKASLLEVTQFHLMENWRKVGYFSGSIAYRDAFLRANSRFLVIRTQPNPLPPGPLEHGNPLADRFARMPGYEIKLLTPFRRDHADELIWLVCHDQCRPESSLPKPPEVNIQPWEPEGLP